MLSRRSFVNPVSNLDASTARSYTGAMLSLALIASSAVNAANTGRVPIDFAAAPALITQIQGLANETANVPATASNPWLTVAVRNAGREGFELALDRSESSPGTVSQREMIGFLAVESDTASSFLDNSGVTVQLTTQRTGNTVLGWSDGCRNTAFPTTYARAPLVFASKISRNGDNGGWLRRCSLSTSAVGLVVDEDISRDAERSHTGEAAAIVSFSEPFTVAFNVGGADQWQFSSNRVTLLDTFQDARFTDVRFETEFQEVPIVFSLATSQGSDPSDLRIRNVTRTGFSIAQVEPDGNDGPHVAMDIDYLAITPGSHQLPDGTTIVANTVAVSNTQTAPGIGGDVWWRPTSYGDEDTSNNQAPDARFVTDLDNGSAPLTVQFDASTSNDDVGIVEYAWQFGDGSSASRPDAVQVSHRYSDAGSFNATLTVTDGEGLSDSVVTTITVRQPDPGDEPPQARFTQSTGTGVAPLNVSFDASGSTDDVSIANLRWDFGDGNTATGNRVSHIYRSTGLFTVTLTVTDSIGQFDTATSQIEINNDDPNTISDADAARFLTQATFGPTLASIAELQSIGYEAWIDQQLNLNSEPHLDWVQFYSPSGYSDRTRHQRWWIDVIDGSDQLRQRMAFALSQIFVTSDIKRQYPITQHDVTNYYDILREQAFGEFRTLLEDVTLNPFMGMYLNMVKNERADVERNIRPDENYAREVMQLFTIGVHELNVDGSLRLDSNGEAIPTYDQRTVEEFARVYTGWHFAGTEYWWRGYQQQDRINPMQPWEEYHDNGSKTLLGGEVVPAGLSAADDMDRALDNIFRHNNVAPFISKQLIQRFITSNPTPNYIRRVANTFNDNGNGVKGDLGAVIKAILLDPEARGDHEGIVGFGKVKEPVIRLAHLFRSLDLTRGTESSERGEYNTHGNLSELHLQTGQAVLRAKTVFNFYFPDYSPVGPVKDANLVAPEFQIATENNIIATTSRIGWQIHYYYHTDDASVGRSASLNLRREFELAADVDALLDHLNLLMLSGSMSPELRNILSLHLEGINGDAEGRSQRARDAINLIMVSPDYIVQK